MGARAEKILLQNQTGLIVHWSSKNVNIEIEGEKVKNKKDRTVSS